MENRKVTGCFELVSFQLIEPIQGEPRQFRAVNFPARRSWPPIVGTALVRQPSIRTPCFPRQAELFRSRAWSKVVPDPNRLAPRGQQIQFSTES